ncbi:hypothetical protein OJ596_003295, partial [Streptococcus anginosus]
MTISIIVPCFNEEESLPLFYAEMEKNKFQLNDHFEYMKQDFKDIILFMEKYFGKNWEKNKYIRQGVQKVNIHSKLAYVVPLFLKVLK